MIIKKIYMCECMCIVVDNDNSCHRYLDNESVSFIIFAFWDFFIHLNMIREVRLLSFRIV